MILIYPGAVVGWKLKESLVETVPKATGEENHDSSIAGILSRSPKMETNKTYDIVVFATDLEGDSLSYGWSKDSGIILDDGNSNTI